MNTLYLTQQLFAYGTEPFKELRTKPGFKVFVIGVRGGDSSLERVQSSFPQLVIERLPEAININHISEPDVEYFHMLQPAFLSWNESK